MKKELSVIVTSYKNAQLLKLCLTSLTQAVENFDFEIIVADGETQEETYDLMREEFGSVLFVPNQHNVGFSALVNQGLKIATGEFVFIINSDIIVKSPAVTSLMNYLKSHLDVGIVSPKLINFDNSVQPSCFRYYGFWTILYRRTLLGRFAFAKKHLDRFLMKAERKTAKILECDWVMGSALMTRRTAIKKVGWMDDRIFMYFEDVDWCWRFWENDFKVIFYPEVELYHYHGKQSANRNALLAVLTNKYTRIHIKSAIWFAFKHLGRSNPRLIYYKKHARS